MTGFHHHNALMEEGSALSILAAGFMRDERIRVWGCKFMRSDWLTGASLSEDRLFYPSPTPAGGNHPRCHQVETCRKPGSWSWPGSRLWLSTVQASTLRFTKGCFRGNLSALWGLNPTQSTLLINTICRDLWARLSLIKLTKIRAIVMWRRRWTQMQKSCSGCLMTRAGPR